MQVRPSGVSLLRGYRDGESGVEGIQMQQLCILMQDRDHREGVNSVNMTGRYDLRNGKSVSLPLPTSAVELHAPRMPWPTPPWGGTSASPGPMPPGCGNQEQVSEPTDCVGTG